MQTKQELEQWYTQSDPWQYETIPDDQKRKDIIIQAIKDTCGHLDSILDIGAGEGFITKDLPADEIAAIELSDTARDRMPEWIKRHTEPRMYDAVITTGTLYPQYDHNAIAEQVKSMAKKYVIVSGIESWLQHHDFGEIIYQTTFPYRTFTQLLTIYDCSSRR